MARKKYPLKQVLIHRNYKMEITLNENEVKAVIEAGLKATNLAQGIAIADINVTQSRKTGKATIALEVVTPFGSEDEVETVAVEEPVQEKQLELPLDETKTEEVVEEAESVLVEQTEEPVLTETVEEEADSLFGSDVVEEPVKNAAPAQVESDSLFG